MRIGNDEEAIKYFKLAIKKDMNINAIINISILQCKDGKLKDAIETIEDLIQYQPFNTKVLLNYNTLLMQETSIRHELIRKNFQQIFDLEKDHEKSKFNYAIYLLKQKDPDE